MPEPDISVYWASGSPPAWRVLLALKEKGLAFKSNLLNMTNKEHKSADVLAINPRGQVPTCKFNGVPVNESLAAIDYIERQHGNQGTKLMPDDPKEQAKVVQRMHETQNIHNNMIKGFIFYLRSTKPETRDKAELAEKKETFTTELNRWEGYLKESPPNWHIATKNFSLADVAFYPYLALLVRVGLPLKKLGCDRLISYHDMVSNRPTVKATRPPHWKDSQPPNVLDNIFSD